MRRGEDPESAEPGCGTWDPPIVQILIGVVTLTAITTVGLITMSLFDVEAFRNSMDRLAPDGDLTILDRFSDRQILASLRDLGIVATAIATILWLFRRRFVRFLSGSPIITDNAGHAGITHAESVVASGVFVTWAVLGASDLSRPLRDDEAFTFLAFGLRSIWVAWTDYSTVNNHVLHSLLVSVSHSIGGWDPSVLRMPAFLAACLTLPALWWFVRQEHGWLAAALATGLFATSPLFLEYGTNARGYTLLTLFFALSLLHGRALVRRPNANKLWMSQAVIIALGFLATPIMAFPAAITVTWMLMLRYRQGGIAGLLPFTVKMGVWFCIALAITLILYAPVLVVSGFDALFNNPYVKAGTWSVGAWIYKSIGSLIFSWVKWHEATPLWAQVALIAMLAIGVAAPRRPTGHRGVFLIAVAIGTAMVLFVKPVVLSTRMTIFLFLVSNVVIGTGAAFLIEAVLARLRGSPFVLDVTRVGVVALVLGGSVWWASRPGVAERFAIETGFSPTAKALVDSSLHALLPGDFIVASNPTDMPISFYLARAGLSLTPIDVDLIPPISNKTRIYQINGTQPNALERFFLFVDQAAYDALPTQQERHARHFINNQMVLKYLEENGYCYQVVADLPGGRVYHFAASAFTAPTLEAIGEPQKPCAPI